MNLRFKRGGTAHVVIVAAVLAAGFQPVMAEQSDAGAPSASSAASSPSNRTVRDKGSYSLGVLMGSQLRRFGIPADSVSFDKLTQGVRDVVKGKVAPSTTDQENVQELMKLVMQDRAAAAGKNEAVARRFLAENAKRRGVVTTPSGLQYKVLSAGNGDSPRSTDEVTVNYRGTLIDGTEFDSSYKRGVPATFQVDRVIPGWKEALMLMKPGAKWELYIPPQLAYGSDSPAPIPPGSMLKFEVELLSVKPGNPSPSGAGPDIGGGTP